MLAATAAFALFTSCATIHTEPIASPVSRARQMVPRSEPNLPLEPGRERVELPLEPRHPGEPLVLMAISGGGSRSAYYAACVMEQLAQMPSPSGKESMLDSVRVISGISAGSLAAAWYLSHFDQRRQPDFFPRFKATMAKNLQWRTYGHMVVFPPLALELVASPITRTDLLANEIDRLISDEPFTFDHLRVQETRAEDPSPILIVNGTVYNSGQRLVMTNLPPTRFPSLLDSGGSQIALSERDVAIMQNLVQPLAFEDVGSDIGSFRVSQAVAASAAYPIILAPVRLQVYPDRVPPQLASRAGKELLSSECVYVADGGVYENQGVDPLLSLLKTLPPKQPVLLIVIDASQRLQTITAKKHKIWDPISVISRMYDIGTMRPLAFYGPVAQQFHDPKQLEAVMIRMEGYDPHTEATLSKIPTSFRLSNSDRLALDAAAAANAQKMQDDLWGSFVRLSSPSGAKKKSPKSTKSTEGRKAQSLIKAQK